MAAHPSNISTKKNKSSGPTTCGILCPTEQIHQNGAQESTKKSAKKAPDSGKWPMKSVPARRSIPNAHICTLTTHIPHPTNTTCLLGWAARASSAACLLVSVLLAELVHHRLARIDTDHSVHFGPRADNLSMDGARNAVVQLDVELRQFIILNDTGIAQIAER